MKSFEEFVDYLASNGVKSFHIELHEPQREDNDQKEWRTEFEKWKSYRDVALGIEKSRTEFEPKQPVGVALSGEATTLNQTALAEEAKHTAELQKAVDGKLAVVNATEREKKRLTDEETNARILANEAEEKRLTDLTKAKAATEAKAKADTEEYERRVAAKMEEQKREQAAEEAAKLAKAEEKKAAKAKKAEAKMEAKAETKAETPSILEPGKSAYDMFCEKISSDDGTFTKEQRAELIGLMKLDELLRVNNDFSLGLDTDKPVEDVRTDVIGCF